MTSLPPAGSRPDWRKTARVKSRLIYIIYIYIYIYIYRERERERERERAELSC